MTKKKSILWIVLFLIMIVSPRFTFFFTEKYVDTENHENRNAEERPILTLDNYDNFPEEYESYYNDHIPYRNQLISINNSIDYFLFGQSANDNVVIGKDGWLFYRNPMEQSLGYWHFSDEQLEKIANNLEVTDRILEKQGIEFVLFIAPNKETIYRDKLPDYYDVADTYTSAEQLVDYLRDNTNIRVVYPKKELEEAREIYADKILYYKLDTHWNELGGYIGAVSLAKELGVKMPALDGGIEQTYISEGDLTHMLNISIKNGDVDYSVGDLNSGATECEKWDFNTEFIYHTTGSDIDTRKIFVRRDSFSSALAPFFASQFAESIFVHSSSFSQQQIFDYDADVFVLEVVARETPLLEEFRVSSIDYSVESKEDENKNIWISPALTDIDPRYVSIFKRIAGTDEITEYQVLETLNNRISIQVPKEENGEIYVYIFEDGDGERALEKRMISY